MQKRKFEYPREQKKWLSSSKKFVVYNKWVELRAKTQAKMRGNTFYEKRIIKRRRSRIEEEAAIGKRALGHP